MKPLKILVTYNLSRYCSPDIAGGCDLIFPIGKTFSKEEIMGKIGDCDALLSMFNLPIDKEIIDAGKSLKIISNFGVGFNNIDIKYAQSKGIAVCNTPDPVIEPTAELAFALMSDLSRRVSECNRKLQYKEPIKWGVMENLGTGLYNKTLGIIGMGRIGQAVARRANAAGMKIQYYNRHKLDASIEQLYNAQYVTFEEILKTSDYISLHTPLDDSTYHLLDEKALSFAKKGVFIINTARGPVIDEEAMVQYLENGHIGGVGLDVFEKEPTIHEGLKGKDNVVIVPHIGTATHEARKAMFQYAMQNIQLFFEGKNPLSRIV